MRGTELRGLGRAATEGWQAYRFFSAEAEL
jgi:hypothetical protein